MKKNESTYFKEPMRWEIYNKRIKRSIVQAPERYFLTEYLNKINDSDFITEKVEFYIDGELKKTTSEMPYNWTFNEQFFNICTIKIVAYGTILGEECTINEKIDVLILNLG